MVSISSENQNNTQVCTGLPLWDAIQTGPASTPTRTCLACGKSFPGGLRNDRANSPVHTCSNSCRGKLGAKALHARHDYSGSNNPRWRGGISRNAYAYKKRSLAKNPDRRRAMAKVHYEIACGRLVRGPCQDCGWEGKTHAHHENYKNPTQVIWLCPPCHRARHRRMNGAA